MEAVNDNTFNENYEISGLTSEQVIERKAQGLYNISAGKNSKTIGQIITSNVFTLFNLVHIVIFILIIITGKYTNTLFMGVILSNLLIGIVQEIKAKRTIDKLLILTQAHANVIRDGEIKQIPIDELVLDDLCYLAPGNQVSADATVMSSQELEVDESALTGESEPVLKKRGDILLSGSFVVAGSGVARVIHVGQDNYAQKITQEAKRYKRANSEIYSILNKIIKVISILLVPTGLALFASQFFRAGVSWQDAIVSSSAGVIGMIPEGLILLTSIAFAVGVVKLARRNALVQELPGIEVLARVNVLCLDKTGTLTKGKIEVAQVVPLVEDSEQLIHMAVAAHVRAFEENNATGQALYEFFTNSPEWKVIKKVPFSSSRKWSSVGFENEGSWFIGAPEFILKDKFVEENSIAQSYAAKGFRVILLAHSPALPEDECIPEDISPKALVILTDPVRPEAKAALDYFAKNDVEIKIITGDNPATAANVAQRLGLKNSDKYIDATEIPDDSLSLAEAINNYSIFGRVTPKKKKLLIKALKENNNTVAMIGDGVNDVLALREADCSIAMASGSDATKCVAHIVLLNSDFTVLPGVVDEGRQVINNIEKVSSLYLVKTTYSMVLSLLFIIIGASYPFYPIHQTLLGAVLIGIPSFFLALEKNNKRIEPGFLNKVIRTAIPGGLTISINILLIKLVQEIFKIENEQVRLIYMIVTGVTGFFILMHVSLPLNIKRSAIIILMAGIFAEIMLLFPQILELPVISGDAIIVSIIFAALAYPMMLIIRRIISCFWEKRK